jgi:hypothetical protein
MCESIRGADIAIAKKEKHYELEAAAQYTADIKDATDPKLKEILEENKRDELEDHAAKLEKYVEKNDKKTKVLTNEQWHRIYDQPSLVDLQVWDIQQRAKDAKEKKGYA